MEDRDLKISELKVATQLDGREIIPFAKDDANGSLLVSLLKPIFVMGLPLKKLWPVSSPNLRPVMV